MSAGNRPGRPRKAWDTVPADAAARPPLLSLFRLADDVLSRGRLAILIYHRVLPAPDPMLPGEVHGALFERQMRLVKGVFNILPLSEAVERLRRNSLPRRALCITFDDGYGDNAEVALPILARLELTATFFIAAGYLDGGAMWNDCVIEALRRMPGDSLDFPLPGDEQARLCLQDTASRKQSARWLVERIKYLDETSRARCVDALLERAGMESPPKLMMRTDQVRQLRAAGMETGGHTLRHPILARVDDRRAREEIAEGKARLESITGSPVRLFAYPNGRPGIDYTGTHVRMVREAGFAAAVTTAWGTAHGDSDMYQLPRFTPWDRTETRFLLRMLQNYLRRREERVT